MRQTDAINLESPIFRESHDHASLVVVEDLSTAGNPGQCENFTVGRIRPSHFG